jgi:hypothetical protein
MQSTLSSEFIPLVVKGQFLTPRGKLCPLGVMLSLSGEDPMFAPSFFYREECVHPWGRW